MPNYGLRPPPYFSGDLPKGILGDAPYGWEHQPNSSTSNTPFNNYFPSEQFVYERLDWQKFKEQLATGLKARPQDAAGMYSNPPFMGAGQMTGPNGAPSWLKDEIGGVRRIVRGYLRRQKVDATDPSSFVRLYFMYNPEEVARTYQSFGESGSVDPNNNAHIEPDGGTASEPWVATMGFTLYFDRQIEVASIEDHPGVMVDLQAFDILAGELIVGNTPSGDAVVLPTGAALPANTDVTTNNAGMIQPKSIAQPITAVFAPALAVEGIVSAVSARITKFSQRMTPTAMSISITLMVAYIGKNNNQATGNDFGGVLPDAKVYKPQEPGFVAPTTQADRDRQTQAGAAAAVDWANAHLMDEQGVYYNNTSHRGDGPPCNTITPAMTDCSSFVWRAFWAVGWSGTDQSDWLHLGGASNSYIPSSRDFMTKIPASSTGTDRRWTILVELPKDKSTKAPDAVDMLAALRKGDVLVRSGTPGHVAFFYGFTTTPTVDNFSDKKVVQLLASTGTDVAASGGTPAHKQGGHLSTTSMDYIWNNYNIMARPEPFGPTTIPIHHTI
jgi:hypothetical protein